MTIFLDFEWFILNILLAMAIQQKALTLGGAMDFHMDI